MTSDVFARSMQTSNEWLHEIQERLHLDDEQQAFHALRGTLHAIRDRLPVDPAVHFGAQLPTMLRGVYYEGWTPHQTPRKVRTKGEFYELVREHTVEFPALRDMDRVVAGVMDVLKERISPGEIHKVRDILPEKLAAIFPT